MAVTSSLNLNLWDENPGTVSGSTAYGYFDNDVVFVDNVKRFSILAGRTLGYPIVQIELDSGSMYMAYELAVMEYSNQVNQFNIRENLLALQGTTSSANYTHKPINQTLNTYIKLTEQYATEIGLGDNIELRSGSIDIIEGQQLYDLDILYPSGTVELRRVYHFEPPAINRYFDPYLGGLDGTRNLIDSFGMGGMSPAIQFMMMPINETLLRTQAIEMSNQIRRSAYSFEIANNKIKIFPIPLVATKLWIDFIVEEDRYEDRNILLVSGSGNIDGSWTSDLSNAPYDLMEYKNINSTGKQWIIRYGIALVKEMLGNVRGKYGDIPIPNQEIALDGDALRSEATEEKSNLIEQLREMLDGTSRRQLLEAKNEEAQQIQETINKIPMPIYIG